MSDLVNTMKRGLRRRSAPWLAVVLLLACQRRESPPPLKIMPLGDSITQGAPMNPGYRILLWRQLQKDGAPVDFVGSQSAYFMRQSPATDFDSDHEGHWGWTVRQILEHLGSWANQTKPDIVLLHIGSNDVFHGRHTAAIIADIKRCILLLRRYNPKVTVFVAQLIPCRDAEATRYIVELNQALPAMAREVSTAVSPIIVVDQFTGFDALTDTYDGIHPNPVGSEKMAARWYAALQPVLRAAARP